MKTTDCPDGGTLLLYVAGELDARLMDEVAGHVATCASCGKALHALRGMDRRLRWSGSPVLRDDRRADAGAACPDPEEIAAYADGSLDGTRSERVEKHLASCPECLSEVADLWRLSGPPDRDGRDASVAAVVARLKSEPAAAVLRLAGRALEVVRGFGWEIAGAMSPVTHPVPAVIRSATTSASLRWEGEGGTRVAAEITSEKNTVLLTGMVTIEGRPGSTVSVTLGGASAVRGPETPDASGRFGPWPLSIGESVLGLSGLPPGGSGRVELSVLLERDGTTAS